MRTLTHAFPASFRVRHDDDDAGDGRTLIGLAVPYDDELEVSDLWGPVYTEVFRRGEIGRAHV